MKRKGIALLVVAALVATSGCVGLVFGDGLDEEAQPARVDQATLDETGYSLEQTETVEIDETVAPAGQERQIRATNHLAIYTGDGGASALDSQTSGFVAVSTPQFTVAGQPLNPAARMNNEELVREFQGQLEDQVGSDVRDVRVVDHRTEPVLGTSANVTTFAAETTYQGQEITLNVHVTSVLDEGDVVIGIGAHPEALQHQAPEIHALMRGLEHPVEA